jgi:bacterioferritin-associated ferredoxin
VTDSDIRKAVDSGVCNMRQLSQATGCSTTCGCCKEMAAQVLQEALKDNRQCADMLAGLQLA